MIVQAANTCSFTINVWSLASMQRNIVLSSACSGTVVQRLTIDRYIKTSNL